MIAWAAKPLFRRCPLAAAPIVWLLLAAAAMAQDDESAPQVDPVAEGRDALSNGDFNWYDEQTDDLRPINVVPQDTSSSSSSSGSGAAASGAMAAGALMTLLAWTALAIVIAVLGYFLINVFLQHESKVAVAARKQQAMSDVDRKAELPVAVNRDIDDLLAAARQAASEGNLRDAIIFLYSHQLVVLDRNRLIRLTKGKTNRQYLREVFKHGTRALGGVLEQTLVAFEDVFFGNHALEPARFESCWNRLSEFDRLVQEANR